MRGATATKGYTVPIVYISIHAPHAGRDDIESEDSESADISIHAPHAGRDLVSGRASA